MFYAFSFIANVSCFVSFFADPFVKRKSVVYCNMQKILVSNCQILSFTAQTLKYLNLVILMTVWFFSVFFPLSCGICLHSNMKTIMAAVVSTANSQGNSPYTYVTLS